MSWKECWNSPKTYATFCMFGHFSEEQTLSSLDARAGGLPFCPLGPSAASTPSMPGVNWCTLHEQIDDLLVSGRCNTQRRWERTGHWRPLKACSVSQLMAPALASGPPSLGGANSILSLPSGLPVVGALATQPTEHPSWFLYSGHSFVNSPL